jgi:hypothetical protein
VRAAISKGATGISNLIRRLGLSPDGRHVLTASEDGTARLCPASLADVPPPDWCFDFLVWLGGKRIAPNGQIETLSEAELLKVEARLRPHMNENTDYARLLAFAFQRR